MLTIEETYHRYGFKDIPSFWLFKGKGSSMKNTLENFRKVYPSVYKVGFIENLDPTKSAKQVTKSWRRWAGYSIEVRLFAKSELGVKSLRELEKRWDEIEEIRLKKARGEELTEEEKRKLEELSMKDYLEYSAYKVWKKFKKVFFKLKRGRKWYSTGKFIQAVFQAEIGYKSPVDSEVRVLFLAPWHVEPREAVEYLMEEFNSMASWLDEMYTNGITVDLENYSVGEIDDEGTISSWTNRYHTKYLKVPYGTTSAWYKVMLVVVVDLINDKVMRYLYNMNEWWDEWVFEGLE